MNDANILITSAGRRVELLRSFVDELSKRLPDAKVFTSDLKPKLSAACQLAENSFASPHATDPSYTDWLLETSISNNVRLIVPTIDTELLALALVRAEFEKKGIAIAISSAPFVTQCRDKRRTAGLFSSLGISTPKTFSRDSLQFPCFAKPYDGSCSIGTKKIETPDEATEPIINDPKLIFMEYIGSNYTEYTVDCYYDLNSNLTCLVPRERIEVRAGEVSKGITRKNAVVDYLRDRLKHVEGARGCITFQFFVERNTLDVLGIEINPRFGGGYPLTYAAGANYSGWLIDEIIAGKNIPSFFDGWENGLMMLRYDAMVLVRDAN